MEQKKLDEINTNEITKEAWNAYQEDYAKLHMPDYEWAKSHAELDCYEPMISLIGDVKGLKLLDTCCSADAWQTYSWHNRGAKVTVKEFAAADREWMRFIVLNRESNSKIQEHEYDIVIGPTANDNTRAAIQTIMPLTKGQVMTDRAIDALITLVEPDNLPEQFFFGTGRAADLLRLIERRIIL